MPNYKLSRVEGVKNDQAKKKQWFWKQYWLNSDVVSIYKSTLFWANHKKLSAQNSWYEFEKTDGELYQTLAKAREYMILSLEFKLSTRDKSNDRSIVWNTKRYLLILLANNSILLIKTTIL